MSKNQRFLKEEAVENKSDFTGVKGVIIAEINEQTTKLGRHNDSHFEAHRQNLQVLQVLIDNSIKVLNIVARIRKQQKEASETEEDKGNHFNLRFFKVRKSSFAIATLALLVLILTLSCMKQQNNYALLLHEYRKQNSSIRELDGKLKAEELGKNTKAMKNK